MATFEVPDLDSSTDSDWRRFTSQLADRVAKDEPLSEWSLSPDFLPEGADALEMRFRTTSRGTVVCVSSGLATPRSPWRPAEVDGIHVLEEPVTWADRFASTVVTEIRHTWNVPHPAFLVGSKDGVDREGVFGASQPDIAFDAMDARSHSDESTLSDAVRRAVEEALGPEACASAEGSFRITMGQVTAYVYLAGLDEVRLHAPIVERIGGRTRAAELVADLNRRHPRLKFLLVEDRVHVAVSIDARPFVPQHLMTAVARMAEFVGQVDDAFAAELGGEIASFARFDTPAEDTETTPSDDVPAQLMTLLELDAESGGAVDADDIVAVCGPNRAVIARYEAFCVEQAESWKDCAQEARLRGENTAASECEDEAVPWDRIVRALRQALRTVGFYDNA